MMRRKLAVAGLAIAALGTGLSLAVLPAATTQAAARNATFFVPANDGYGIADCVLSGSSCGAVVANAWCEAQGFRAAARFGLADVTETAAIGAAPAASRSSIEITCAE